MAKDLDHKKNTETKPPNTIPKPGNMRKHARKTRCHRKTNKL